ncbi:MAG: acyl-CoA thioesterase [Proteobacteria bacterium]|nr:acyl-CoA thioesterase [Pseudomonadota bacterium]MBU1389080.1 acyl-CoA thioesterase [Pseudomonadota bacterium]MBU1543633.1 acyl-CoA thioesterase [Pseudomonadota bacterium]MBU2429438.1 acyl-CoA thioesterase [Pseudomonadota bacterium]MBU2479837.1 acyl-CoA thioesterase [Pseudomonadota bacterium]
MNDAFCHLLRVRYAECDAQKVVFNAKYAEYVDIAATEFMRAIWGSYNDLLASGVDNQVVKLTISWKAPARFDDVLAIRVKPFETGSSSYTLQLDFYNFETIKHLASAQIVYVMVSTGTHKKMIIPDHMRKAFEAGAPGIMTDHAGVGVKTDIEPASYQ